METNTREMMKKHIETIEGFFQTNGTELEVFGELSVLKVNYKVRREMGIMQYLGENADLDKVVEVCKDYIKANKSDAEWLMRKGIWGLPLEVAEKVELAKYHTALQYVCIFYR